MQFSFQKKYYALIITIGLITSMNTYLSAANPAPVQTKSIFETINFPSISNLTAKQAAVCALLAVVVAAVWTYKHKKTQPKRVYPKDDSAGEIFSYIWNEIIVGQEEQPLRPTLIEMDIHNPNVYHIKHENIEPRGIVGITHSYTKDVVVPALTALVLFNGFKKQIVEGLTELAKVINDPAILTQVAQETAKEAAK